MKLTPKALNRLGTAFTAVCIATCLLVLAHIASMGTEEACNQSNIYSAKLYKGK